MNAEFSQAEEGIKLTDKVTKALALAIKAHDGQYRKKTAIPYIAHPMVVASIALEHWADEDLAMAAPLHDAVKDGGGPVCGPDQG